MGGDLIVKVHICFVVETASGYCYLNKRELKQQFSHFIFY
ncbi:hypothetical protein ACVNPX_00630 [Staphylococcus aureus]